MDYSDIAGAACSHFDSQGIEIEAEPFNDNVTFVKMDNEEMVLYALL